MILLYCTIMKNSTAATVLFLLAISSPAASQSMETEEAVLELSGASSLEDLSEDTMESYFSLASHALNINSASERRLVSSGLFSRYQAASLKDYIKKNGPVRSVMELMLVDGFSEKKAEALAQFISFEAVSGTGGSSERVTLETSTRASMKVKDGDALCNEGMKIRVGNQDRWSLAFTAKNGYGEAMWPPGTLSGSLAYYSGDGKLGLYAGDFAGRFGQGLVMWSGFTLSGAQSAASFAKHPSGLAPSWTFSPASVNRGVAADVTVGRTVISTFWSPGSASGVNVTYLAKYGQLGMTWIDSGKASIDWRWSTGRLDIFGEAAYDYKGSSPAGLAGCTYNFDYKVALSALTRYYSSGYDGSSAGAFRSSTKTSDEKGVALAFDCESFSVTTDAAFHPSKGTSQHKTVVKCSPHITDNLGCSLRGVLRYRPQDSHQWREEVRAEMNLHLSPGMLLAGGAELCRCMEPSWLAYADAGYTSSSEAVQWRIFLHMTAFKVDNWDDRIYLYERDIPGAFSVPAYYGRGYSISCVATCKWGRCMSLNFKVSNLGYPGMTEKKPGRTELKCLFVWNL